MKKNIRNFVLSLIAIAGTFSPISALAADRVIPAITPQQKAIAVSNRLIVKLKPVHLPTGLSSAQIATELRRPFSAQTLSQLQAAAGVALTESHAISNGAHILILHGKPDRQTVDRAINNIRGLSEVDYVEEDRILTTQAATDDTYYVDGSLWGLKPVTAIASPAPGGSGNYGADFETAWNTTTGLGVVVAVVDTGITAHADIGTIAPTGNLISSGYDFITDCRIRGINSTTGGCAATTTDASAYIAPSANASDTGDFIDTTDSTTLGSIFYGMATSNSSWHGTHVSGTIAAIGNNTTGVVGGAYSSKILPVRVLGKGGGYVSDITEGIKWAANVHPTITPNPNPAKVINLSLGGSGACSTTEQTAINAAVAAGAVVIVAAGNSNKDVLNYSPANCSNIIVVAAIGRDGSRSYYSNYSSPTTNYTNPVQITLAAQGGDTSLGSFDLGILSTVNTSITTPGLGVDGYVYKQGTSMATPHVAAAAALMLAVTPALTPAQIKNILAASTTTFPSFSTAGWASYDCATLKNCGAGILNAKLAVQNSVSPLTASVTDIDFGSQNATKTSSRTITFTGSSATLGTATITGINSATFSITNDTCSGATTTACQLTINYTPVRVSNNSAVLLIPANPATNGAIVVGLTGKGIITLTSAEALAATKGSGGKGGCSIMPAGSNPDISLLFALLAMTTYRFRRHLASHLGKN